MDLAVVSPAQRNRKLIADLAAKGRRLGKAQMVGIGGMASSNLVVQLGNATEELNRRWYQANSGQVLTDVQRRIRHPVLRARGGGGRPRPCP